MGLGGVLGLVVLALLTTTLSTSNHPREGREQKEPLANNWVPAFAGMNELRDMNPSGMEARDVTGLVIRNASEHH